MSSSMAIRPPVVPPVDLAALTINPPPVPAPVAALNPSRDREAQLLRRIRELEDDLRVARVENEKQVSPSMRELGFPLTILTP